MTSKSQKIMHAFFKATLGKPQNFDAARLGVAAVLEHLIDENLTNSTDLQEIINQLRNQNENQI